MKNLFKSAPKPALDASLVIGGTHPPKPGKALHVRLFRKAIEPLMGSGASDGHITATTLTDSGKAVDTLELETARALKTSKKRAKKTAALKTRYESSLSDALAYRKQLDQEGTDKTIKDIKKQIDAAIEKARSLAKDTGVTAKPDTDTDTDSSTDSGSASSSDDGTASQSAQPSGNAAPPRPKAVNVKNARSAVTQDADAPDYKAAIKALSAVDKLALKGGKAADRARNKRHEKYPGHYDLAAQLRDEVPALLVFSEDRERLLDQITDALYLIRQGRATGCLRQLKAIESTIQRRKTEGDTAKQEFDTLLAKSETAYKAAQDSGADPKDLAPFFQKLSLARDAAADHGYTAAKAYLTTNLPAQAQPNNPAPNPNPALNQPAPQRPGTAAPNADMPTLLRAVASQAQASKNTLNAQLVPIPDPNDPTKMGLSELGTLAARARARRIEANTDKKKGLILQAGDPSIGTLTDQLDDLLAVTALDPKTGKPNPRVIAPPASQCVATIANARVALDAFDLALQQADTAWRACDPQIKALEAVLDPIQVKIAALHKALQDVDPKSTEQQFVADSLPPIETQLARIHTDFGAVQRLTDPDPANAAQPFHLLLAGLAPLQAEANRLATTVQTLEALLGDPTRAGDPALDGVKVEVARAEFAQAAKDMQTACDQIYILDPTLGAHWETTLDGYRTNAAAATTTAAVEAVTQTVRDDIGRMQQTLAQVSQEDEARRKELLDLLPDIKVALDDFKATLEQKKSKKGIGARLTKSKDRTGLYTQNYEGLLAKYNSAAAAIPIADLGALDKLAPDVRTLAASAKAARQGLLTGTGFTQEAKEIANGAKRVILLDKEGSDKPITLEDLVTRQTELRAKIDNLDFRSFARHSQVEMLDVSEALKISIATDPIMTSKRKVDELEASYKTVKALLKTNKAAYKIFKDKLDQCQDQLQQYAGYFDDAPNVLANLQASIDACRTKAKGLSADKAKEAAFAAEADKLLAEVVKEINDVIQNPATAMTLELNEQNAQKQRAADKGTYNETAGKLRQEIEVAGGLQGLVEPTITYDTLKDLREMLKIADANFEAGGDLSSCLARIEKVRKRFELMRDHPELDTPSGRAAKARQELARAVKQWREKAGGLRRELQTMSGQIAQCDAPGAKDAVTAATTATEQIALLFNTSAFDTIAKAFAEDDPTEQIVRSNREQGLRLVRRYKKYLAGDIRLALLRENEFDDKVAAEMVLLNNALANIEFNILRTV